MPLNTPDTAAEIADRAIADVELALAPFGGKPALPNSYLNAIIVGICNRQFDFYGALDAAALEALPDTAVDNLERWAAVYGIFRIAGEAALGFIALTGEVGAVALAGSAWATGDGKRYASDFDAEILAFAGISVTIARVGSTATATFGSPHGLASNVPVTFSGATQPEYNVAGAAITVVSATAVSYQVSGAPATPATGAPVAAYAFGTTLVRSEEFGSAQDQELDAAMQLESPIAGIDDVAFVNFDELGGGSDRESNEALRDRLLLRIRDPIAHFNVAEITSRALAVPGVTRVFVLEVTPTTGEVTIYFMRDNDLDGAIPNGAEIAEVVAALDEIRPANTGPNDVHVLAPAAVTANFVFSALLPNTATMKAAIEANLQQLFAERADVGEDVPEDAYRSAIFNTVDTSTGEQVASFTLTGPVGDIAVVAGEIAVLDSVTFP